MNKTYKSNLVFIAKTMGDKLLKRSMEDSSFDSRMIVNLNALDVLDRIKEADPTPKLNFMQWLARMYVGEQFRMEDISRVRSDLEDFIRVRPGLENKDLNSYKSFDELYEVLKPFEEKEVVSNRQLKRLLKDQEATMVIDTEAFKVVTPNTHSAACLYGANTKWCTNSKGNSDTFNNYNKQGPLYIIITNRDGVSKKFQLHYESNQFTNEKDQSLTKDDIEYLSSFDPHYLGFLNMLIEKHYSKYFEDA